MPEVWSVTCDANPFIGFADTLTVTELLAFRVSLLWFTAKLKSGVGGGVLELLLPPPQPPRPRQRVAGRIHQQRRKREVGWILIRNLWSEVLSLLRFSLQLPPVNEKGKLVCVITSHSSIKRETEFALTPIFSAVRDIPVLMLLAYFGAHEEDIYVRSLVPFLHECSHAIPHGTFP
jgi:hypothetical protein